MTRHIVLDNNKLRYAVYPGSEKLDLGDRKTIAVFEYRRHAEEYAKKWGQYADIVDLYEQNNSIPT
jgi:hypothetical protein